MKSGGRKAEPLEVRRARGERLKRLREALALQRGVAKVSHDKVAESGGFKRAEMSKFEKGENLSSVENVRRLARAYGVSLDAMTAFLDGEMDVGVMLASAAGSSKWSESLAKHVGRWADSTEASWRTHGVGPAIRQILDHRGGRRPCIEVLVVLRTALGMTLDEMLGLAPPQPSGRLAFEGPAPSEIEAEAIRRQLREELGRRGNRVDASPKRVKTTVVTTGGRRSR